MMKTKQLLYLSTALFILSGCSTSVTTHFLKRYPQTVKASQVRIIEKGDSIPSGSDTIGYITVAQSIFDTRLNEPQLLYSACKITAKAGGNTFAINHITSPWLGNEESFRLTGTALYVDNDTINSSVPDYAPKGLLSKHSQSRQHAQFGLSAYIGPGWIISKVYAGKGIEKGITGMNWKLSFEHFYKTGWGYKINYSGARTYADRRYRMLETFIGPMAFFKGGTDKWLMETGAGIGFYGVYRNYYNNPKDGELTSGIGFNTELGLEYILTSHFSLGALLSMNTGLLASEDYISSKNNELSGIKRVDISVGFHYYF